MGSLNCLYTIQTKSLQYSIDASDNYSLLQDSITVTSITKVYQNISECVELYQIISKYDTMFVFGIIFYMFVFYMCDDFFVLRFSPKQFL